jgi:hypothetical protein
MADATGAAPAPSASPQVDTPTLSTSWAGPTMASAGGTLPPDNTVAEGTTNIIAAVNVEIVGYSRTGTLQFDQTLNSFFNADPNANFFDPRVLWDQYAGRFIVVSDEQTGAGAAASSVIYVAVSKTSNPADGWNFMTIDAKAAIGANDWLDYPMLGYDSQNIYISGLYFDKPGENASTFQSSAIFTFNRNTSESGATPTVTAITNVQAQIPAASFNDLYAPAHIIGTQVGFNTSNFFVSYNGVNQVDILRYDATTGTYFNHLGGTTPSAINVGNISNGNPVGASQPNSPLLINTGDTRVLDAIWRDNKLFAVTEINIGAGAAAHDVVHWFEFDTTNPNNITLVNQGNIDPNPSGNMATYFGNLTVDTQGNIIIGYSASSPTQFASSAYITLNPNGTPTDSGKVLTSGQGVYTLTDNNNVIRWGDYSGISLDPLNNLGFAVFNQFATNANSWATTVGVVTGGGGVSHAVADDFNASGSSGLLFQAGGTVFNWTMQNGAYSSGNLVTTGATGFTVVGTGDFNNDHTSDLLLQNGGTVVDWLMNNSLYSSGNEVSTAAAGWQVVGTGDFTGNGTSDILLQNGGTVVDWLMNNGLYSSGNVISTAAAGWQVVGTGDFTGNGTSDVLLQNGGTVVDWIMKNGVYQSGNVLTNAATGWQVVGTGDFTGNGTSDVLLQNGGTVVDWLMNNGLYSSGNVISTAAAGWNVASVGDFNGDGTADIALRNGNGSGSTVVTWAMHNGLYLTGNVVTTSLGSNFGIA